MQPVSETEFTLSAGQGSADGSLRLPALLQIVQDSVLECIRLTGLGPEGQLRPGFLWVILQQHLMIEELPQPGQTVRVRTWPGRIRHLLFPSFFLCLDAAGRPLIRGNTVWTLLAAEDRRMTAETGLLLPDSGDWDRTFPDCMDYFPPFPTDRCFDFSVPDSFIDWNGHMNNVRYAETVLTFIPRLRERSDLKDFRVDYLSEARARDKVRVDWGVRDETVYLEGRTQKNCFRMRLQYESSVGEITGSAGQFL